MVFAYFYTNVLSSNDYYAFGMIMPGRNFNSSEYRFGFNGQEKDDEISGVGNSYTAEFWQYDPRLGRRWNTDPVVKSWESSYACFAGNPIFMIDPNGDNADEWDYDVKNRSLTWVSDKGGNKTQHVNVINKGEKLGEASVEGNQVHVYKLRNDVVVTGKDWNFNDETYNSKSNYEYSKREWEVRKTLLGGRLSPIGRAIKLNEASGSAKPLTNNEEEKRYGYSVMRLRMLVMAIDQAFDLMPSPISSPKIRKFNYKGVVTNIGNSSSFVLKGYSGGKALTGRTSWHRFLQVNKGKYSGKGWQKRAAADYYKSEFYKK